MSATCGPGISSEPSEYEEAASPMLLAQVSEKVAKRKKARTTLGSLPNALLSVICSNVKKNDFRAVCKRFKRVSGEFALSVFLRHRAYKQFPALTGSVSGLVNMGSSTALAVTYGC